MFLNIISFSELPTGSQADWVQAFSGILAFTAIIITLWFQARATKLQAEATKLQASATEDQLKAGRIQLLAFQKSNKPKIEIFNVVGGAATFGIIEVKTSENTAKGLSIKNFCDKEIVFSEELAHWPNVTIQPGQNFPFHYNIIRKGQNSDINMNFEVFYSDMNGTDYKEQFDGTLEHGIASTFIEVIDQ